MQLSLHVELAIYSGINAATMNGLPVLDCVSCYNHRYNYAMIFCLPVYCFTPRDGELIIVFIIKYLMHCIQGRTENSTFIQMALKSGLECGKRGEG